MRKLGTTGAVLVAAVVLFLARGAHANLVVDGGFESPVVGAPGVDVVAPATNGSWTVVSGSIDLIHGYWVSYEGNQSVDMSGINAGTLAQTLTTTAGQEYTLTFALAGNPDGSPTIKEMLVDWGGTQVADVTFNTTGHSDASMGWVIKTVDIPGIDTTSASTTLEFISLDNTDFGPALDDVSVNATAVPLPAMPSAFVGLVLLGGVGLVARRGSSRAAPRP